MELKDVKFYIGPMSKNIVDTILDFSIKENYKIGIIPSRRQVDWDGGYVNNWTTDSFIDYLYKSNVNNIILERDHGGIAQGKYYDNGTTSLYIDATKFDIIHVDPWSNYKGDFQKALDETADNIKFINKVNPELLFEVGTEESICYLNENDIDRMLSYLKIKLGELFNKITPEQRAFIESNPHLVVPSLTKALVGKIQNAFGKLFRTKEGEYDTDKLKEYLIANYHAVEDAMKDAPNKGEANNLWDKNLKSNYLEIARTLLGSEKKAKKMEDDPEKEEWKQDVKKKGMRT